MTVRGLIALALLISVAFPAAAEEDLLRQVRHEFASHLHPLDRLLPGYERPPVEAPTLAVGDFVPDDESLKDLSTAIGGILRWRIQYTPTVHIAMPSAYYTSLDAGTDRSGPYYVLARPEDRRGIHDSLGIDTVLTGTMVRDGDELVIDALLVDAVTDEEKANRQWRGEQRELPEAIIGFANWVYNELDIELGESERAYLEDRSSITPEAFAAFAESYVELGQLELVVQQDRIAVLRQEHPNFPAFAALALFSKPYATNLSQADANLQLSNQAREQFPNHAGIALESYRTLDVSSLPERDAKRRIEGLRDLVIANPNDPMILINLGVAYGEQGDVFEGLSLSLEAVDRWPGNYRAWWNVGWLVNQHAWQVRGDKFWSQVPEDNQDRFRLLAFLADQIIDKALALHDRNGVLWNTKLSSIGSNGGYSPKLMAAFEQAASLAPSHEPVYSTTLNFAQNKWGGNAAARRRIIELAEENNPDAAWPRFMRSQHQADFEGLQGLAEAVKDEIELRRILENPVFWKALFFVIASLLSLSGYITVRRAKKRMAEGDQAYEERYDDSNVEPRSGSRELTPQQMFEEVQRKNRG